MSRQGQIEECELSQNSSMWHDAECNPFNRSTRCSFETGFQPTTWPYAHFVFTLLERLGVSRWSQSLF